jgi:hypothetical protein
VAAKVEHYGGEKRRRGFKRIASATGYYPAALANQQAARSLSRARAELHASVRQTWPGTLVFPGFLLRIGKKCGENALNAL